MRLYWLTSAGAAAFVTGAASARETAGSELSSTAGAGTDLVCGTDLDWTTDLTGASVLTSMLASDVVTGR